MSCKLVLAFTMHLLPGDWNEVHPGGVCQADNGLFGAAYYNSESKLSLVGGYDMGWLELGLATGYSAAPVVPMIRVAYDINDNVKAFGMPAATVDGEVGVVFGLEVSLP